MELNIPAAFAVASTFLPAFKDAKNGQGVPLAQTMGSTLVNAITMNAFSRGGLLGSVLGQVGVTAALMGGGALLGGAISVLRTRPKYAMSIAAPWSAGYVHCERASLSLRRGLEAINGAQSMIGSEAATYAAKYSR